MKFKKREKPGRVISEENATEEVQDFLEHNKIVIGDLDKDERAGLKTAMTKLARAIMDGDAEIKEDDGEKYIVQRLSNGEIFEYKNQKMVAQQAMSKAGDDDTLGRLYSFALSMANRPFGYKIPNSDSSLVRSIALILFS